MSDFTLLPAKEYLQELILAVHNATSSIYIMNLILADDEATHELILAIEKAASRGIHTDIAVDIFTYGELGGFFSPFKKSVARSRAVTAMTKRFIAAGVNFRWLGGNYKVNPFAGVTHIKWSIVDKTIYCFGGVNLYKLGINSTDYMLKTRDTNLIHDITKQHLSIASADASPESYKGFKKDYTYGSLLVDSGERGRSIIYERACELAKEAHKIIYVSQYCPDGELLDYFKEPFVQIYFNRPELANFFNGLLIRITMLRTNIKTLYRKNNYIHAKFMLFEMADGRKIALTGSHNFSYSGVRVGTREVALETENIQIYTQLKEFWEQNIK